MSNLQLMVVALAALLSHILAAGFALVRRRTAPVFILNLAVAGGALMVLFRDPRWLRAPIDWQVVALAVLQVLVLAAAAMALRGGYRAATVGSWAAFGLNFLVSGLAVVFALTFKITRLI